MDTRRNLLRRFSVLVQRPAKLHREHNLQYYIVQARASLWYVRRLNHKQRLRDRILQFLDCLSLQNGRWNDTQFFFPAPRKCMKWLKRVYWITMPSVIYCEIPSSSPLSWRECGPQREREINIYTASGMFLLDTDLTFWQITNIYQAASIVRGRNSLISYLGREIAWYVPLRSNI